MKYSDNVTEAKNGFSLNISKSNFIGTRNFSLTRIVNQWLAATGCPCNEVIIETIQLPNGSTDIILRRMTNLEKKQRN